MSNQDQCKAGHLYIVATPIGNLGDISQRAIEILQQVDRILAEDTRHSGHLLHHLGIQKPMWSCHEHNEEQRIQQVLTALAVGESLALISDAGTPLINDPGYRLVTSVTEQGYPIVPIPGPSALITALSIAGLPTDRFAFEGFLPAKTGARVKRLQALADEVRTLVFYESSHRIVATLADLLQVLGRERPIALMRELTKRYEQVFRGRIEQVVEQLGADPNHQKGEFVLVVHGAEESAGAQQISSGILLQGLLEELPASKAASLAAKLTGLPRKQMYEQALKLSGK